MASTYFVDRLKDAGSTDVSDALERGEIVYLPLSPVPFPPEDDLRFLREDVPARLGGKNVSYHPEADRVVGLRGSRQLKERTREILREHNRKVQDFLRRILPALTPDWTVGTSSFRPLQERGRDLPVRASNERLHVDARAYGATHGDRILRFFMNAHTVEDRIWATKGTFSTLYRKYAKTAGIAPEDRPPNDLEERIAGRFVSGLLGTAARLGLPMSRMLDTSPYDRLMRRFHNFMKESRELHETGEGREEIAFKPGSAWMVFTDMVSHACVSGQHAFIDTFIIPLGNCRFPERSPYHILKGRGQT